MRIQFFLIAGIDTMLMWQVFCIPISFGYCNKIIQTIHIANITYILYRFIILWNCSTSSGSKTEHVHFYCVKFKNIQGAFLPIEVNNNTT